MEIYVTYFKFTIANFIAKREIRNSKLIKEIRIQVYTTLG
jgi:hypothetical protein